MRQTYTTGFYIGTMSGTSADGLDIVIAEIESVNKISLFSSYFIAYPSTLSKRVQKLQLESSNSLSTHHKDELAKLDDDLAIFYAEHILEAVAKANLSAKDIIAIGNHGQTILHQPNAKKPFSLQICNAQSLARICSIPVIADFRYADIQEGGQGAPLMPAFHVAMFEKAFPCSVVNIGGISNTSLLSKETVLGFDNGPGNTLMDAWINKHQQLTFDNNGDWAKSGSTDHSLLKALLNDPYFSLGIPKSTGQDKFNIQWLEDILSTFKQISPNDVQATLCDLTAKSIINDIKTYKIETTKVYVCGGGTKNSFLMERLKHYAGQQIAIHNTGELGIDPDWMEALGFAWLAFCNNNQITANLPSVTGAKKAVLLGQNFDPKTA